MEWMKPMEGPTLTYEVLRDEVRRVLDLLPTQKDINQQYKVIDYGKDQIHRNPGKDVGTV